MMNWQSVDDYPAKCSGLVKSKRRYETAEAAYQKGQEVYQCRYCYGYHRSGKFGRWLKELERINGNTKI
jgi:hypothetical protein